MLLAVVAAYSSVDGGGESVDPADVFRINVECVPGVC